MRARCPARPKRFEEGVSFMLRLVFVLPLAMLTSISMPTNVYAYLDPGSGSYVLQIILAFVLGGLYSLKFFMAKIRAFLKHTFSKKGKC